jgi:hypothetical protein
VIALREPVSLARVDEEVVLNPEPAERTVEVDRLADRHVGVVSPCTMSTGVRTFDANEIGLT